MGVTIHFEGKLKDKEAYESLMASSMAFASETEWPFSEINESEVTLQRVKDEED